MRKVCKSCGVTKPRSAFYFRKDTQAWRPDCKICTIDAHTCQRIGITKQELLQLEVVAEGRCQCCKRVLNSSRYTRLAVDHDHLTGAVRGLLCTQCNTAIGLMEDDPVRLAQAIDYLNRFLPQQVIGE